MLAEIQSWTIGLGAGVVALLTLLYVFYERILVLIAWLLHVSFALGFALATTSLALEGVYAYGAARAVASTGIPARLRQGDDFVRSVQELPERILERVRHPFASSDPPSDAAATAEARPPGALEGVILPILEGVTAFVLRVVAFGSGIVFMCIGLFSRTNVDLVLTDRALRKRIEALEARLAER